MKKGYFPWILIAFLMGSVASNTQTKDSVWTAPVKPRPERIVLEQILIPEIPPCPIKTVNKEETVYYHEHFKTLDELPLDRLPDDQSECFRVFDLNTMQNPSTAFFFKNNGKYFVRYKNIPNCSFWNKEAKIVTREAEITLDDWKKIRSLLERWISGISEDISSYIGV